MCSECIQCHKSLTSYINNDVFRLKYCKGQKWHHSYWSVGSTPEGQMCVQHETLRPLSIPAFTMPMLDLWCHRRERIFRVVSLEFCLNSWIKYAACLDMWELWDMTQFLWSTSSLSCHLVQLIIGGRLGSGKAAQLVVYLNLNLRRADFSSVCYIWRVCMSARPPNMSGLDGLASVQPSHAKFERLSEALIRGKDGQSCRFPFPT